MKVTEATDKPDNKGNILYYEIRTDKGTCLGSAFGNPYPINGDPEITLEDAKKNATLWASAPDLLEALEGLQDMLNNHYGDDSEETHLIDKAFDAIEKARGL